MTGQLRWQDVKVDSIWREKRHLSRLVRVYVVYPPEGPKDHRLVSVMIRTVIDDVSRGERFAPKPGSRETFTTVDRLGRDFEKFAS